MNLRRLVLLAICLSTAFGLVSLINGWPRTAAACSAVVVALSIFFLIVENLVRRHLKEDGRAE